MIDTTSESAAYREINPKLAIADDLAGTWEQAIEAKCGAVAMLTSKRVGDKSADEVLASLSDGAVLMQLAARGTFYNPGTTGDLWVRQQGPATHRRQW